MTHSKTHNRGNPLVVSFMPKRNEFINDLNYLFHKGLQESNNQAEWIIVDQLKIYSTKNAVDPFDTNIFRRRKISKKLLRDKIVSSEALVFIVPFCLSGINLGDVLAQNKPITGAFTSDGEKCLITRTAFLKELPIIFSNQIFFKDISMRKIFETFLYDFFECPDKLFHYIIILNGENKYNDICFMDKQGIKNNSSSAVISQRIYEIAKNIKNELFLMKV